MPTPFEPSWSDSWTDLWRKIDYNLFLVAQTRGYTDFLEPNALDNQIDAMRKSVLYTAFIANNP